MNDGRLDEIARRLGGPDWERQLQLVSDPLFRSLALAVGVDLAAVDEQQREVRDGLAALMQAAVWFAPFGWTVSARILEPSTYSKAVELWQHDPDQAAIDEYLTRSWASPVCFRQAYGPMTTLAGRHEPTLDLLLARNRLLDRAYDLHTRGEYEASVLITLSQIAGLTLQFTESRFGFFIGAKPKNLVDDSTIAGMPEVLLPVWHHVTRPSHGPSLSGAFQRHGIMHGAELEYGTEVNSTKAFALLGGVIDWLKPKAAALTEKWQTEDEVRAGPAG